MNVLLVIVTLISLFIYNVVYSVVLFLTPRRFRKMKDVKGQKVLITGAGNGLGRQIALQFSKHSTCLILLDINKHTLLETAQMIDPSSRVFTYECDVTNRKMVYAVSKKIKDEVGDVDILVNNAGTVCGKSLIDLPDHKILKTMEVNAISHFWICKSFLPSMMAKNKGHIVTIASIGGLTGGPRLTDYCASKFAAIGFSESLELELRSKKLDGIKITIVNPSDIDTELSVGMKLTIGRPLTPEYVAEEIIRGILEERETIVVPSYLSFLLLLKSIVPRWVNLAFFELTDNIKTVENSRGRSQESRANELGLSNQTLSHRLD